jgi:WD40 repeat protein
MVSITNNTSFFLTNEAEIVHSMGSLVSLENLNDPHDQKLFRGHDNQITSLAVSSGGNFIATGQMGTKSHRGNAAPVLLWSLKSQHKIHALKGLTRKVNLISFSTDERFVCGCDEVMIIFQG